MPKNKNYVGEVKKKMLSRNEWAADWKYEQTCLMSEHANFLKMTDGEVFFYCTLQKCTIKKNTPPSTPSSSRSLLDFLRHYTHPPLVFLDLFYFASFFLSMILYLFFSPPFNAKMLTIWFYSLLLKFFNIFKKDEFFFFFNENFHQNTECQQVRKVFKFLMWSILMFSYSWGYSFSSEITTLLAYPHDQSFIILLLRCSYS